MFQLDEDFDVDENFLNEVLSRDCNTPNNFVEPKKLPILIDNDSKTPEFSKSSLPVGTFHSTFSPACSPNISHLRDLTSKVRSRKFPGPAGLLPERQINTPLVATDDFLDELEAECRSEESFKEGEILSQGTVNALQGVLWESVLNDFGIHGQTLVQLIDINSVRTKAKVVRALKVPFLVLTLQNLDTSTPDPCLFLRDPSGEMCGALHRDVWEKFSEELIPESVLVLINVGVVSAGTTSIRHYLNITANNICAIYSNQKDGQIKVIRINPVSEETCFKLIDDWKSLEEHRLERRSPPSSPSLFNSLIPGTPQRPMNRGNPLGPRMMATAITSQRFAVNESRSSYNNGRPDPPPAGHLGQIKKPALQTRTSQSNQSPRSSKGKAPPPPTPAHLNLSQDMFNQSLQVLAPVVKKPRSEPTTQTFSQIFPSSQTSTSSSPQDLENQSIVESLLEGIDADSLFGDF